MSPVTSKEIACFLGPARRGCVLCGVWVNEWQRWVPWQAKKGESQSASAKKGDNEIASAQKEEAQKGKHFGQKSEAEMDKHRDWLGSEAEDIVEGEVTFVIAEGATKVVSETAAGTCK